MNMRLGLNTPLGRIATLPDLLVIATAALLVLGLVVLVVAIIVARSRRRERLMAEAVRAGQPELALYIVQGPRRLFAALLLLPALLFLGLALPRLGVLAIPAAVVAAVCLYMLFRRPNVKIGRQPLPPPPVGAPAQPPQEGAQAPSRPTGPPPPPVSLPSNGIFETALAIAMAILVVFAGLILLNSIPVLVLVVGIGVLFYLMIKPKKRAKCFGYLSRQAGRLRDWLERKARQQ